MVIDNEVYLSCKKGYCSNAKGIALIQLDMIPSISAEISVKDSFLRQDNEITLKVFGKISNNYFSEVYLPKCTNPCSMIN